MAQTSEKLREISSFIETLNEEQYEVLLSLAKAFAAPETEEQKATRKQKRQDQEKVLQEAKDEMKSNTTAFEQWKENHLHNFSLPSERYDITTSDSDVLIPYMSYLGLNTTEVWDGICNVYLYGFKRGMAYQKKH
ncbi:MAG: hypothetical protein UH080_05610 [Ruminococcus sp.]|nr:hypothetical protein [Ruminococcus sp.]